MTARRTFFVFCVGAPLLVGAAALVWAPALWVLIPVGAAMAIGLHDSFQSRHSILRAYPILGHGRFLAERVRPEIQQYFVESNTNGTPFSREVRAIVYQRAKGQREKLPFGTQLDVYEAGHEYLSHSLYPAPTGTQNRVTLGGPHCTQPYDASLLNISAMSFGALSATAIRALGEGAAAGGFALNTGEGGVSDHHLDSGADLIWQIGTGYFGCRDAAGSFDPSRFSDQASLEAIKAIEIKLSQGAKPAHGGILPGAKVTPEIARIRGVVEGQTVLSPPGHSAFSGPGGLLEFVRLLRNLSDGKPIGFKLCVGEPAEFAELVEEMQTTGITPDFITIDGSEGGTGAAPPELTDSVGMPLREALAFAHSALVEAGLKDSIRLIAAGKVATGFDMARSFALGADLCYSARAMMMSLGCIQARKCHSNDCPVGVATQDPQRSVALVVADKAPRVERFHRETVAAFLELVAVAGCMQPADLGLHHIHRRIDQSTVLTYADIYGAVNPAQPVGIGANTMPQSTTPDPNHPDLEGATAP